MRGISWCRTGSGARIDLDAAVASDYIQSLYAPNPAIPDEQQAQLTQLAHLPLFGYADGKASGYAALVSGARASCELTARVKNNVNVVSNIYAGFTVCDNEESTIGADRGLPVDYMYARRWLTENPEINYVFLRDTFDSDEIAAVYRETLGRCARRGGRCPGIFGFSMFGASEQESARHTL